MDPSPIISGGASVALLIAIAGVLIRLLVVQNQRDDANEKRITAYEGRIVRLEDDNRWCNERVSILINACLRGGIEVPQEVWDGPPKP